MYIAELGRGNAVICKFVSLSLHPFHNVVQLELPQQSRPVRPRQTLYGNGCWTASSVSTVDIGRTFVFPIKSPRSPHI
jgi:hypothetical protein